MKKDWEEKKYRNKFTSVVAYWHEEHIVDSDKKMMVRRDGKQRWFLFGGHPSFESCHDPAG